jgi:hypothetical protein
MRLSAQPLAAKGKQLASSGSGTPIKTPSWRHGSVDLHREQLRTAADAFALLADRISPPLLMKRSAAARTRWRAWLRLSS